MSTVHLVTFSDSSMTRSAELCVQSAERNGVNDSLRWHQDDLKLTDFYVHNRDILDQPKGAGLWTWKPWIILKALQGRITSEQFARNSFYPPEEGDILIYADAGIEFINNAQYIVDRMDQDIFLFGNQWEHAHWCKRDIVEEVWNLPALDQPYYDYSPQSGGSVIDEKGDLSWEHFGKQAQASVIFFRVSDYSRRFVAEWLKWCLFEGGRLIDDSPSRTSNHPEFRENRHDQAILTTLAYREGIKLHWWPAQYNDGAFVYERGDYPDEGYPVLFNHHRKRNHEWVKCA